MQIAPSADVSDQAVIGEGTTVWHLAQIREGARVGRECIVGRGAYIDAGVQLGNRCKIQNHALIYAPARLDDGVFVGPAAVFTNDMHPRAITLAGELKTADDWESAGVTIGLGASIGARAVVLGGVHVGNWAMVAAGSVVTRDVGDHSLVIGAPARHVGWVGRAGHRLDGAGVDWRCPRTGERYLVVDGRLEGPR